MADVTYRRALRSSDLPRPRPGSWAVAPTRRLALSETISAPEFREVAVAGRPVLLTRLPSGEVVAFAADCPHQGTSLRQASLYEGNLRCPQHNYVYDVRTGRNILPTRDARPGALARLKPGHLTTYPVRERDGWVLVGEEPSPHPAHEESPAAEGPGGTPGPERPTGTLEHEERALTAVQGQDLELVLPTHQRPSHLWRLEAAGAPVEILGQRYHEDAHGLSYRIRVRLQREGVVRLLLVYGRPWDPQPSVVQPFVVHVTRS